MAIEQPDAAFRTPEGGFVLAGPSITAEKGHLPVRGDLAHIKLAGRCFVPHYAVPMPHRVRASGAALLVKGSAEADQIGVLSEGAVLNVLDIAGDWCWGQVGDDGPVGYIALSNLEQAEP